jgi:hypothetical protein
VVARDQPFLVNTDPDPDDQNLFFNYKPKNFFVFFHKKWKIILTPPERTSKLKENSSSLKGFHPALQNLKFLNFWFILASLDPYLDPADQN